MSREDYFCGVKVNIPTFQLKRLIDIFDDDFHCQRITIVYKTLSYENISYKNFNTKETYEFLKTYEKIVPGFTKYVVVKSML